MEIAPATPRIIRFRRARVRQLTPCFGYDLFQELSMICFPELLGHYRGRLTLRHLSLVPALLLPLFYETVKGFHSSSLVLPSLQKPLR